MPEQSKLTKLRAGRSRLACLLATAVVLCLTTGSPAEAAAPESTRALASKLAHAGRAEATLSWSVVGPPGSAARAMHGTLAVEPPDLARLDVAGVGEKVTLRADGGEWLQPELNQFVRLTPRHSVAAMRWWRLLAGSSLATGASGYDERKLAPGHYRLLVPATPAADADSADVWLDAGGLPARLSLADGMGGETSYRLSGWRFAHAKGIAAFRLTAPPGVETVEMP